LGFGVWGVLVWVLGFGSRVHRLGLLVEINGLKVEGLGFRFWGFEIKDLGLGFWVWGLGWGGG